MKQASRISTNDTATDRAIENVRQVVNAMASCQLTDGQLLQDVTLADSAETLVRHGLGRKWTGYIVCSLRGASTTGRIVDAASADDAATLSLTATGWGAALTVSLWVF